MPQPLFVKLCLSPLSVSSLNTIFKVYSMILRVFTYIWTYEKENCHRRGHRYILNDIQWTILPVVLEKKVSLLICPCGLLRSKSICKFRLKLKSISFKLAMGISYTLNPPKKIYHSKGDTDLRLSISHGIITIQWGVYWHYKLKVLSLICICRKFPLEN